MTEPRPVGDCALSANDSGIARERCGFCWDGERQIVPREGPMMNHVVMGECPYCNGTGWAQ